jgi:hypothetical protein
MRSERRLQPIRSRGELIQGLRLGRIGVGAVVQVPQLLAEQDPSACQVHEHGLFFASFGSLRHAQALHRVALEVDDIAHLPHSY